jgi:hypothetical protein
MACVLCFSSCGKEDTPPAAKTNDQQAESQEPAIPKAPPPKAELAGSPTGSGFTSESIRVQVGPDEGLREQHHPKEGNQFLFVRLAIKGSATLIPKDYRIVVENKQHTPHAVGFGRPSGVYSSVEYFVGEQVQLAAGEKDQILHDGERIQKSELKNPMVFLVYDIPQTLTPTLWHGSQSFPLAPNYQALAADLSGEGETLASNGSLNVADPNATSGEFSAELLSSTRTRLELNTRPTDVVVLTVELSSPKPATIELGRESIALRGDGGSAKGGTVYLHFSGGSPTLTAGSSFIEGDKYEDRDLIGLNSGSYRLTLAPANPVTMTIILPDPKTSGELELSLTSEVAVTIPEPVNPLGKFPPPVEKMPAMVAWSPIIGTPIEAGYLSESVSMASDHKQIGSPAPRAAGSGLKYLLVRFRVDSGAQFVPLDYRIAEQESNTVYKPIGVSFGDSPVYVKGLDYEQLALKMGGETRPTLQGGKPNGWTLKTGEVRLLFEVAPADAFIFIHGETQFLIELGPPTS